LQIVINPEGKRFEILRGNYFHKWLFKTGSTDGKNFKRLSGEKIKVKEGESNDRISPHVSLQFVHEKKRKVIHLSLRMEGRDFPLTD
jgi:hypothetical protein